MLLVGCADVSLLVTLFNPLPSLDGLILLALLGVLLFLVFGRVKSPKDLDLPSIFGKR